MTDEISPADALAANCALWNAWTRVHRDSASACFPEYNWPHGIDEVVTALIGAGPRI